MLLQLAVRLHISPDGLLRAWWFGTGVCGALEQLLLFGSADDGGRRPSSRTKEPRGRAAER
jgi:hypothetical protein